MFVLFVPDKKKVKSTYIILLLVGRTEGVEALHENTSNTLVYLHITFITALKNKTSTSLNTLLWTVSTGTFLGI